MKLRKLTAKNTDPTELLELFVAISDSTFPLYYDVSEFIDAWSKGHIYNYGSAYTIARIYEEEELGTVSIPEGSWYRGGSINLDPGNGEFNKLLKLFLARIDADCYTVINPANAAMIRQCEYYNMTIVGTRKLPDGLYNVWKWSK